MTETRQLNGRQQSIVSIAAFTASGELERLKPALNRGLDSGLTINEIKEVLVQMYAYSGFPRSLNRIFALMGVLEERKARGITDEEGEEAKFPVGCMPTRSPRPRNQHTKKRGTE